MHAEATSEKIGMGWRLDGRVTAVVGTHTHVPTADARILPGGTAYITDVGMTGPRGGVIGVKRELAIQAMVTKMPVRFEISTEDPWLNGVVITAAEQPLQRERRSSRCSSPRRDQLTTGDPLAVARAASCQPAPGRGPRPERSGWPANSATSTSGRNHTM